MREFVKKLSYILPCYNVERYIAECLDSIYAQNLPEDEYEVICVNDCSTDGTRPIIVDYSQKHSNLTLIDHTENLTAGGARNSGIETAKGEYIWFVDPDDMIEPNCLVELYSKAASKLVDVLMFNFRTVDEYLNPIQNNNIQFRESDILPGQDFVLFYTPGKFSEHCMVWRCLFRATFLIEKGLLYPIMRKAQDVVFLWKVLLDAKRVGSVGDTYYVYRRNPNSVINHRSNANVFFSERILFANEIAIMLEDGQIEIKQSLREDMLKALNWCVNSNLEVLIALSRDELEKYYQEIVGHRDVIEKVKPYMNRKSKFLYSTIMGKSLWLRKVEILGRMK